MGTPLGEGHVGRRLAVLVHGGLVLSHQRGKVPALPAPVQVEPVENQGTLIILTPERFTASNPDHLTLAGQVQELLGDAGLLKPVTERLSR
ncbi:Imm52 family immunity protein [Corallococcus sp. bb12-1]|uniref:Imm52 family immunity protein n=1 Tax=Corallococcus sp. bb12-1 TaxID=2996784 RepID=UPI0022714526|nr:Imm52 family immunity protein [Corallococcus sp. bb12-1]MCY1044404.1 Imm52 family immunity protein [Corallococcus sp. bb12-1]